MYFKGGKGIKKPKDLNRKEIKEGDILTFDWFDCDNPIGDMRRKFTSMQDWTDDQIFERIHQPTFNVKLSEDGIFFGEGIEEHEYMGRMYLHDFRFKYTKVVL